uniref:Uncharacterized protein n=1 Tax=viral metagenome TaxID=1070528 RepID=A0A6C0AG04_9ZZZZ
MEEYYFITYLLIFLLIIIIFAIFFFILYFSSSSNDDIIDEIDFENIEFNIIKNNNTIIELPIFGDDPAIELNNNEAILVFFEIPKGYIYWGITGNLYDISNSNNSRTILNKNIGDSISIADYYSSSYENNLAVILTKNKNMFNAVKYSFNKEFREFSEKNLKILPIFISSEYDKNLPRYNIIVTTVLNHKEEIIPNYKCRFYKFKSQIPYEMGYNKLKINKNLKNESELYDLWNNKCDQIIQKEGFKTYKKAFVSNFYNVYNNRDITCLYSEIQLENNEDIVVVALDHCMTGKCIYSDITFVDTNLENFEIFENDLNIKNKIKKVQNTRKSSYYNYITGSSNTHKTNLEGKLVTHVIYNNNNIKNIRIIEKLYVNYNSRIGPEINTILPMNVYIVKKDI